MHRKLKITFRKKIAIGLLAVWIYNLLMPFASYALTSGPSQPEARAFQPAGVSDMVDLFTGDFKYNIPLLDVDGYPVNLNYQSGSGMDDEASWAGLGWNVNIGAINRQLRGVPDDMAGDNIQTEHYTKPKVTIGGRVSGKAEFFGKGQALKKWLVTPSGSFSLGIFNDSYTGIGADVSVNAGISYGKFNDGPFTASLGIGLSSSTASGVDVTPTASLGIKEKINDKITTKAGLSASLGYNSRSGLKNFTLGSSFDVTRTKKELSIFVPYLGPIDIPINSSTSAGGVSASGSLISYNTEPVQPAIQIPYRSRFGSFSIDIGPAIESFYLSVGATGYKNVREVASKQPNTPATITNPGYGFLYAEKGKDQKNAIMDLTRENENPVIPELPNLAIPVPTPDLFSYTSQIGSGQFRLYRGGSGAFFDNEVTDDNRSNTIGGDVGFGVSGPLISHAGITWYRQTGKNTSRKWTSNNSYLAKGDFQNSSFTDPNYQHAYFKVVGEKTVEDGNMAAQLHDDQALAVSITGKTANASFTDNTLSQLQKQNRAVNTTVISYLTAEEAAKAGLDKTIKTYPFYDVSDFQPPSNHVPVASASSQRFDNNYHQKHHLSEITVTDEGGKRMVYGLPVYNIKQTEYSFAIGKKNTGYTPMTGTNNIVNLSLNNPNTPSVSIDHAKGIDQYYHAQTQPAYASSFLLTGILSPDYVDRTGNGISADDPGTAIKFNYSRLQNKFKWRTPFHGATLNRSLLADKDDDKASIVYGEKEICYISSIESKTKIAYFITQDRRDAMGVTDFTGTAMDSGNPQKCLKEIRLYSRADMSRPIKVVKFEYDYELCRGLPNNADNAGGNSTDPTKGGKLTLKKVYFLYGNSPKGANYPYTFTYKNTVNDQPVNYGDMLTDRWGVYKAENENLGQLKNDEFPYTHQDIQGDDASVKNRADENAALWHLSSIHLPTGGTITMNYEADDYAYVQNKRAMAMSGIESLILKAGSDPSPSSPTYLKDAIGLKIKIPNAAVSGDPTDWFKKTYLNGSDHIYTKFLVKIANGNSETGGSEYENDFIPCYSKVKSATISGSYANVILEDRNDGGVSANPIIFSAWQKMKNEYPRYAFPGFDRRTNDSQTSSAVGEAVKAVLSAIGNLSELTENFYQKANRKRYAAEIKLDKCFVKLTKQDGHKLGGGIRVKKIQINDSWQDMSGNSNSLSASYGQAYAYTTVDDGKTISSGVAAYEPSVGNDENPLKQPVPYVQNIKGAIDDLFDLEEPFGESFFPAPSVGYSKVTVTDLDKNGEPDPALRTGYSVDEFYTAKDFPVEVTVKSYKPEHNKPINTFSFLGATSIDELTMTQGYGIVLNDMHGKPRSMRTYNRSGAEITSSVIYYHSEPKGADSYRLKNTVDIVNPDGSISSNQVVGRDIDFFTDFREFESKNSGRSDDAGYDFIGWSIFSFPFFYKPGYDNSDYKLFRSACAVKVSQYYGIVDKVVKTENGSSITTQNMAFDGLTGDPVVTRTQNEFNNYIYSVNIPAYWVYKGMGGAYQNSGMLLKNFTTDANAQFNNYGSFLKAGDELADLATGNRYWVIEDNTSASSAVTKKLVSLSGEYVPSFSPALVKLLRSGYRNMLGAATQSIVSLVDPIQGDHLRITSDADLTSLKVINASASTFNESWPIDQHGLQPETTQVLTGNAAMYGNAQQLSSRGSGGIYYFAGNTGGSDHVEIGSYLQAGLNRSGIWPNPTTNQQIGHQVDIETDFTTGAGDYYLGYSGDDGLNYSIDGFALPVRPNTLWCMYPITLTSGSHHLSLRSTVNNTDYPGAIGMEVYTNSGGNGNPVFTTANLANVENMPTYVYRPHINPYVRGFLGNWRERSSAVFQQSRHYNPAVKGVDVKNAGYISNFSPYWYYGTLPGGAPGWTTDQNGNRARWITANTVTGYDQFGQQLENKDALGRYSAALFGFNGELPVAVASNAKNREIYNNGFEDGQFTAGSASYPDQLNEYKQTGTNNDIRQFIVPDIAHSGNYSVLLPSGGLALTTSAHTQSLGISNLLSINEYGEYSTKTDAGLYPNGFEPSPGKSYIFDVWVKDDHPADRSVHLQLNAGSAAVTLTCKALVEDWKLLEGTIDLSALTAGPLTLTLTSSSSAIYLDDIRIHPKDGQMKTYVYDDKTMRLMAEIDENGFATLYEYDDEGLLIRVKKETERGVMTIKETRSSYKKGS